LNEGNSSHAGLAQQNGLDLAFLHRALKLAQGTAKANTCHSLARWFDWSRWVAVCSPSFSLMGELGKK